MDPDRSFQVMEPEVPADCIKGTFTLESAGNDIITHTVDFQVALRRGFDDEIHLARLSPEEPIDRSVGKAGDGLDGPVRILGQLDLGVFGIPAVVLFDRRDLDSPLRSGLDVHRAADVFYDQTRGS